MGHEKSHVCGPTKQLRLSALRILPTLCPYYGQNNLLFAFRTLYSTRCFFCFGVVTSKIQQSSLERSSHLESVMSMSDLAPLVAAALRDQVVADLQKENEDLRSKLALARRGLLSVDEAVTITGVGGSPVYAKNVRAILYDNESQWSVSTSQMRPTTNG